MTLADSHSDARSSAPMRGRASGARRLASPRFLLMLLGISMLIVACGPAGGTGPGKSATQDQPAQASSPAEAGPAGHWKLTWSAAFNKPGALNKWLYYSDGTGFGLQQLQWYDAANASITKSGQLAITADRGGSSNKCWYGPCKYTSARMETKNSFSQTYGEFEARIKFPAGQGFWPAFWIEGADVYQVGWPACGEIDIVEPNTNNPYLVPGAAHAPNLRHKASLVADQAITAGFHTYGVVWNAKGITWYFDGHPFSHMNSYKGWPFDKPFFIILDLAVGGSYTGPPSQNTQFPAQMVVDWVRVYRHVAG